MKRLRHNAILELVREGVVARRRGQGTVVLHRRAKPGRPVTGGASVRLTEVVVDLLTTIESANREAIGRAAEAVLETIVRDRLIHVAGTGHGLALVLEAFYRPGGLANINPVWDPAMLLFNGARNSTTFERTQDVGRSLAAKAGIQPADTLVVFSQSGVNPLPIELAVAAKDAGAATIAVTSVEHSSSVPCRVRPWVWRAGPRAPIHDRGSAYLEPASGRGGRARGHGGGRPAGLDQLEHRRRRPARRSPG